MPPQEVVFDAAEVDVSRVPRACFERASTPGCDVDEGKLEVESLTFIDDTTLAVATDKGCVLVGESTDRSRFRVTKVWQAPAGQDSLGFEALIMLDGELLAIAEKPGCAHSFPIYLADRSGAPSGEPVRLTKAFDLLWRAPSECRGGFRITDAVTHDTQVLLLASCEVDGAAQAASGKAASTCGSSASSDSAAVQCESRTAKRWAYFMGAARKLGARPRLVVEHAFRIEGTGQHNLESIELRDERVYVINDDHFCTRTHPTQLFSFELPEVLRAKQRAQ